MLDPATCAEVRKTAQEFWDSEVESRVFQQIAKGKEIGHRIADFVDEQTTALLSRSFVTKYQCDSRGRRATRSMGDIWIEHGGLYHPVNVKAGVAGREGQPNMVSLKKLLDALLGFRIDSYYLLVVKVDIGDTIKPAVSFVDMLDYLGYVTFDSGPGQIMLKARAFFGAVEQALVPERLTLRTKVERLMALLEDGERRLAANRARSLASFRKRVESYLRAPRHVVTPATQEDLHLQ